MNSGEALRTRDHRARVLADRCTVNWTGKLVGCAIFEPLVEGLGYKRTIYTLACIQIVAVTSEHTVVPNHMTYSRL
jgi:hypothetical protein